MFGPSGDRIRQFIKQPVSNQALHIDRNRSSTLRFWPALRFWARTRIKANLMRWRDGYVRGSIVTKDELPASTVGHRMVGSRCLQYSGSAARRYGSC